ncbi:MAG: hypothetical protein K6T37_01860 [Acidothermus cellulolyticus]|nr:hypothetical protein [Acidothermus cellulolyticus]
MAEPMLSPRAGEPVIASPSTMAARYDAAMNAVHELIGELNRARARGEPPAVLRGLHARIDYELARAIAAARAVHDHLFAAAGGRYQADNDPDVLAWKRRLNDALTLRSQHQFDAMDEVGAIVPAVAPVNARMARTPRQAGLEFDTGSGDPANNRPFDPAAMEIRLPDTPRGAEISMAAGVG